MPHPLLTASGFNRSAIMVRAWTAAKVAMVRSVRLGLGRTLRGCFADALRTVWDEARSARSLAVWRAEQDAATAAASTLDVRTREIEALRFDRFAATGIDNAVAHFAAVARIDAHLSQLGA